jgi:hypothetical protein
MKTLTKATTTDRVPRRATTVVSERPGARPRPGGGGSAPPRGGRGAFDPGGPGVGPGTASAVRIGVPIAQALWAPWFKEQLLKDIEALPKPEADTRQAGAYLRDPRTREAAKTLDILGKNLPAFTAQLDGDAARTIGTAKLELAATALVEGSDQAAYERRIERIDAIKEQLSAYLEDLLTIRDNLDALLELEGRATEAKRSSDELYGLLDDKYVAAYVVEKDILSVEQLSAVKSSLSHLSVTISMTFGDAHAAHDAALRHIAAIQDMLDDVGAIWWSQMGEQFEAHLKARHAAAMASADRQEKAAGVPSPQRPSTRLLNSDELGTRALYNTREAEIRRELGMLGDPVSGESPETAQRRRELLDELIEIREARRKAGL